MVISWRDADTALVQFFTFTGAEREESALHASAIIHLHPSKQAGPVEEKELTPCLQQEQQFDLTALAERCTRAVTRTQHYQAMEHYNLYCGPSFQGVEQLWYGEGETLARVRVCPQIKQEQASYILHPALLATCLFAAASAIATEHPTETYLPVGIDFFSFKEFPGEEFWVYAQQDLPIDAKDTNMLTTTLFLLNDVGQVCAEVKGLSVQWIGPQAFDTTHAIARLKPMKVEVSPQASHTSLRQRLQEASDDERLAVLSTAVTGCVAKILGYSPTRINQDMTLRRLGLDSLMTVQVRNTLARELEVSLPLVAFFGKKSLRQLVQHLYEGWVL
jgi:acyl carrier protein